MNKNINGKWDEQLDKEDNPVQEIPSHCIKYRKLVFDVLKINIKNR